LGPPATTSLPPPCLGCLDHCHHCSRCHLPAPAAMHSTPACAWSLPDYHKSCLHLALPHARPAAALPPTALPATWASPPCTLDYTLFSHIHHHTPFCCWACRSLSAGAALCHNCLPGLADRFLSAWSHALLPCRRRCRFPPGCRCHASTTPAPGCLQVAGRWARLGATQRLPGGCCRGCSACLRRAGCRCLPGLPAAWCLWVPP